SQQRYVEAQELYKSIIQLHEQLSGPEHLDTAQALYNLASLYADQAHYRAAEPLYARALHIREQQLGPEHPQTRTVLRSLAMLQQHKHQSAAFFFGNCDKARCAANRHATRRSVCQTLFNLGNRLISFLGDAAIIPEHCAIIGGQL